MKKFILFAAFMISLLFVACEKDGPETGNDDGQKTEKTVYVNFNAKWLDYSSENEEDVEKEFTSGSEIGIYAWTGTYNPDDMLKKNAKWALSAEAGVWIPSTENDSVKWDKDNTPHYFVGVCPPKEIADIRTMNFSSEDEGIMIARILGEDAVKPSVDTVQMSFRHLLAKVNVKFVKGDGFEDKEIAITKVYFQNAGSQGFLDLVTMKLYVEDPGELEFIEQEDDTYSLSVVPQKISGLYVKATVNGDADTFVYNGSLDYKSGVNYMLTFTITKDALVLDSINMEEWSDGDDGNGMVAEPDTETESEN